MEGEVGRGRGAAGGVRRLKSNSEIAEGEDVAPSRFTAGCNLLADAGVGFDRVGKAYEGQKWSAAFSGEDGQDGRRGARPKPDQCHRSTTNDDNQRMA